MTNEEPNWDEAALESVRQDLRRKARAGEEEQGRELEDSDELDGEDEVASTAPSAYTVGSRIGPYILLKELGKGGCGVVWEAEQTQPIKHRVALKLINSKFRAKADNVITRFAAERQILADMNHPNIAKIYFADTTSSGQPYFVMELVVGGKNITKYCDEKKLALKKRLDLFVQVCEAIQHAHQRPVIHRDIKPSNVLIALYDGKTVVPKVIDFGIAKVIGQYEKDNGASDAIRVSGTPEYMSPEQTKGRADTRSDVYALGVLLYKLVTGTTPFNHKGLNTLPPEKAYSIIREEEPPKPSECLKELKPGDLLEVAEKRKTTPAKLLKQAQEDVDWIVTKCLEIEPKVRYQTPNELAQDIKRFLHIEPVKAHPPSVFYHIKKFHHRHRWMLLELTTIMIVSTLFAFHAWKNERQAKLATVVARVSELKAAEQAEEARLAADAERRATEMLTHSINNHKVRDALFGLFGDVTIRNQVIENLAELKQRMTRAQGEERLRAARFGAKLALVLHGPDQPHEVIEVLKLSVRILTDELGEDDFEVLAQRHNLALAMYDEAREATVEQALALSEQVFQKLRAKFGIHEKHTLMSKDFVDLCHWWLKREAYKNKIRNKDGSLPGANWDVHFPGPEMDVSDRPTE